MLRTLKMRTLEFLRPSDGTYTDSSGRVVKSSSPPTPFTVRGSLQPLSRLERETIPGKNGVTVKSAFIFYTKTSDIRPIDEGTPEADRVEIGGVMFVVWANAPWQGIKATTHNVITLVREDEVALDD